MITTNGIDTAHGSERAPDRDDRQAFEAQVTERFGILPNFFRSARAAPELIERLWSFAEAAYLDNPMPPLLKERLFVSLSRFCPVRYCIIRHVGFLLGHEHGRPAGAISSRLNTLDEVVQLLRRPTPWNRDMESVYQRLAARTEPLSDWPEPGTDLEDKIFACAALLFNEPARGEPARRALLAAIGERKFELLAGFLAFIRTAHYWTMLHPEIEIEEDMTTLLRRHEVLAHLLLEDEAADRCEMGNRVFEELTALRDLHERKELENAKRALEEKDRQKDQFIAILAHELRNPLAAIRAATDLLTVIGTSDSRAEYFRALVDRQSTAMTRMLEDLLDVSRVAFQKVAVSITDLDLTETIRSVAAEHEVATRAKNLELNVQLPETPCHVRADEVRLRQVIDNLLSNAIKFTPTGGQITLQLNADTEAAVLRVTDTGIGFDDATANRLFEPFFQAPDDLVRQAGGLGLGLALSARLAQLQSGSLRAESPGLGRGATFSLTIPRAAQTSERARTATLQPAAGGRILIVEDNADVASSLAELINALGFTVEIAADGQEALARARTMSPDIVLCDLGLPNGMDGYALAKAFQREQRQRPMRLIAASGYSRPEDYANARAVGFEEFLAKPVTLDSLRDLLFSKRDADGKSDLP